MKKAQLSIGDAPTVVLIVGFVFLVMATMAYIGEKYGSALDTEGVSATTTNETLSANITQASQSVARATDEDFATFSVTQLLYKNYTSGTYLVVPASNYTVGTAGTIVLKADARVEYNNTAAKISYTHTFTEETAASNVTTDMNTEIENNTSIAGIVLTISLVGIVLSVLIGIFMAARKGGM